MAKRRIDYVLQYSQSACPDVAKTAEMRHGFERLLCENGFLNLGKISVDENCFTVLHCKEDCLQRQAEKMLLKVPLKVKPQLKLNRCGLLAWLCDSKKSLFERCAGDSEKGLIHASSIFSAARANAFKSYDKEESTLFGPATRTMLVHSILSEMNVSTLLGEPTEETSEHKRDRMLATKGLSFLISKSIYERAYPLSGDYATEFPNSVVPDRDIQSTMPTIATENDAMPITAIEDGAMQTTGVEDGNSVVTEVSTFHVKWYEVFGFKFVSRVREHFGETMAFYYAWVAVTTQILVALSGLGTALFLLGIFFPCEGVEVTDSLRGCVAALHSTSNNSFSRFSASLKNGSSSTISRIQDQLLEFIDASVDNLFMWLYGLFLCLFGTIALVAWRRQCAVLTTMWHVEGCNVSEPVRPQYKGDVTADQYADGRLIAQYSKLGYWLKRLVMLALVIGAGWFSLTTANTCTDLRTYFDRKYCSNKTSSEDVCWSLIVAASLLSVLVTYLIDRVHFYLARLLTHLENHLTETEHSNAVAIKLALLSAINQFIPMYYITFFQGNAGTFLWWSFIPNIVGLNTTPDNRCGRHDTCTPLLAVSFFLMTLVKPCCKIIKLGLLNPFLKCLKECCKKCCKSCCCSECCKKCHKRCTKFCKESTKRYDCKECCESFCCCSIRCTRKWPFCKLTCREVPKASNEVATLSLKEVILNEMEKESDSYWIMENYHEKVFLLGHVMLFSVSMPLVTILYLILHSFSHIMDTRDLLQCKRRQVTTLTKDIGIWKNVLQLMSISGVVTTCILMGSLENHPFKIPEIDYLRYTLLLTIALVFIKGIVACHIPSTPDFVVNAQRQEKYLVQKELRNNVPPIVGSSTSPQESPANTHADSLL